MKQNVLGGGGGGAPTHGRPSSRPDLSHLLATEEGRALYRRIVLAVTRGGTAWKGVNLAGYPYLALYAEGASSADYMALVTVEPEDGVRHFTGHGALPDPENDPAAAWDTCVREGIQVVPVVGNDGHTYYYGCQLTVDRWGANYFAISHVNTVPQMWETPGRAVVATALELHAAGPYGEMIRPLL